MISWAMVPAFRIALVFAIGIAATSFISESTAWYLTYTLCLLGIILIAAPVSLERKTVVAGAGGVLLTLALGVCAGLLTAPEEFRLAEDVNPDYFLARIQRPVTEGNTWYSTDAEVEKIYVDGQWLEEKFRIKLFFAKSGLDAGLRKGALIVAKSSILEVKPPLNPNTFNYQAFLAQEGIYYQSFIKPGETEILEAGAPASKMASLRLWISQRLESAISTPAEFGVMKALLLGDRTDLDDELKDIYTRTGAIHVLAVSGLHTGVVAGIFIWLLGFIRHERFTYLKLALFWSGLLGYVALTGFSPSVQRSAIMFGVLFAGQLLRKDTNPFNSLGLSAILILALNPQLLFSLGFQLSFTAVAGILAFYPTFKKWFASSNYYLNFFGDLTAVSIAATLATAPLTIYYFHQFPLYFVLSGLFAVPLVSLALPCAIAGLAVDGIFSFWGGWANWAYVPSHLLVWICNASLEAIASLPATLLAGLWPGTTSIWISYLAIAFLGAGLLRRKNKQLMLAGFCFLLLGLSVVANTIEKYRQQEIRMYSSKGELAVDIIKNGTFTPATAIQAPGADSLSAKLVDQISTYRESMNLSPASVTNSPHVVTSETGSYKLFSSAGIHWLVVPDTITYLPSRGPNVDYVIAANPRKIKASALENAFPNAKIILANYVPRWLEAEWDPLMERTYILPRDGSLVLLKDN